MQRLSQCKFAFLIEFVNAQSMFTLGADTLRSMLTSEAILHSVGNGILFDVLINNYDRVASIWPNEGNPANLLFQFSPEHNAEVTFLHLIDQTVTAIKKPHREIYLKKLRAVLERLQNDEESVLEPSRQYFLNWTGFDIGVDGEKYLQRGLKCAIAAVQSRRNEILECLDAIGKQVLKAVQDLSDESDDVKEYEITLDNIKGFVQDTLQCIDSTE